MAGSRAPPGTTSSPAGESIGRTRWGVSGTGMQPPMRAHRSALPAAAPVLLVGAIYVLTLCHIEKRGFWIADNANKFLQLQAIVASGYSRWSIPWPGKSVDPEFAYNPLPYA